MRKLTFLSIFCLMFFMLQGVTSAQATTCPTVSTVGIVTPSPVDGASYSSCSMAGADFSEKTLTGVSFNNVDLSGATFARAKLTNVTFNAIDATGADFNNAIISDSSLTSFSLNRINFTGSEFRGITSNGLTDTPTALGSMYKVVGGRILCPQAKLDDVNLAGADLRGVNLNGATLRGATLSGNQNAGLILDNADLSNSNMSFFTAGYNTSLDAAVLTGANLKFTDLRSARLNFIKSGQGKYLDQAYLPTNWHQSSGYLVGPYANLTGASFSNQSFSGWNLYSADLSDASFTGMNLSSADLRHADLRRAVISNSNITNTDLWQSNTWRLKSSALAGSPKALAQREDCLLGGFYVASGVDLSGTDLKNINFYGCNLGNADITAANIQGAKFYGTTVGRIRAHDMVGTPSSLPIGISLKYAAFIGPEMDLSDLDLSNADLSDMDLHYCDLSRAKLDHANLIGANLKDSQMDQTSLNGANLTDTSLIGLSTSALNGSGVSLPQKYSMLAGYILGPQVFLVQQDLSNLDLSGIDLSSSTMYFTVLDGANLTRTNLSGVDLRSTSFKDSNLDYANLTGANFGSADLSGASLDYAVAKEILGTPNLMPENWYLIDAQFLAIPPVPTSLSLREISNSSITLAWAEPVRRDGTLEYRYTIRFRQVNSSTNWALLNSSNSLGVSVQGLVSGPNYEFQVSATNAAGTGPWSDSVFGSVSSPLVVSNQVTSGSAGSEIVLATSGGSGTGIVTYSVTGSGCTITNSTLNASRATTCSVTAHKAASGIYSDTNSQPVNFVFSAASQETLAIAEPPSSLTAGTSTNLSTTGGSGTGMVTYSVTGSGCTITNSTLNASRATTCSVTAHKAASGIYSDTHSQAVIFEFKRSPELATITIPGWLEGTIKDLKYADSLIVTSTSNAGLVTVAVTGSCKLDGNRVTALTGSGLCRLSFSTQEVSNEYLATTVIRNIKLGLAVVAYPKILPPTVAKSKPLPTSLRVGAKRVALSWKTSTPTICKLSSARLQGLRKGTCTIIASTSGVKNFVSSAVKHQYVLIIR